MLPLNFVLALLLCNYSLVHSRPEPRYNLKSFDSISSIPSGWEQIDYAHPSHKLILHIALEQSRLQDFESRAFNIATPGHSLYGQHLSLDDIESLLKPSIGTSEAVIDWLTAYGIPEYDISRRSSWIKVRTNVTIAEQMLATKFHIYNDQRTSIIRTLQYSVPVSLHPLIRMIQPTTRFSQSMPQRNAVLKAIKVAPSNESLPISSLMCDYIVTPTCLRAQYQLDNFTAIYNPTNKLGISGYLEQYASYTDLAVFTSTYAKFANSSNFTVQAINGGLNLQNSTLDSTEANLDIQYSVAIAPNIDVTYYSTGGRGYLKPDANQPFLDGNDNEPYLDQLLYLLDLPDEELPTVLSTSYGEDEQTIPPTYANVTCNLFAQLGARGVSVIFASGDSGPGAICQTNDGFNRTRFLPMFPASCPFVTSVGGTTGFQPERAVGFSSGGFSDFFPRPSYQEEAVYGYLAKIGDQWSGLFNRKGRGMPDVAARSTNFYVYDHGTTQLISGTSCSAPVFAGIIANLNNIRLSLGVPPLGFLNPFLYKYGVQGLTDITAGRSRGCGNMDLQARSNSSKSLSDAGWNATEGWDPVTGLGTPIFPKLVDLMLRYAVPGN